MNGDYIAFPELGIRFDVSPVAFTVFGREVFLYGVTIAVAFAFALVLAFMTAKKFGIDQDVLSDLVIVSTPSAIIFARLFYVVFEWKNFKNDLSQIFNIRGGGLAIYGGVIGIIIAVLIYSRIKKIRFIKYFDFIAPYFVLAHAIGRFGNFFNQEAFGRNTDLPWGMTGNLIIEELLRLKSIGIAVDPGLNVHPTFLYEFLWNMTVFCVLLYIRKNSRKEGQTVFAYMSMYGFGRMLIEGLRTDSLMIGSLRVNQLLAFALFAVFGYLFYTTVRKPKPVMVEESRESPFSALAEKIRAEEKTGKEIIEQKDSDKNEH